MSSRSRSPVLEFRDINLEVEAELTLLVDWANDPAIRHLFRVFKDEAAASKKVDPRSASAQLAKAISPTRRVHLALLDGLIIGEVSVDMAHEDLHGPSAGAAWLGIVIGVEAARGKGLGAQMMLHAEELARQLGAVRAEIGVFAFNLHAQKLYAKLGYQELSRTPNITWWQGKTWSDIRMSKAL